MTEDFRQEQGASTLNDPKPRPKPAKRRYTVTARDIKKKVAQKIKKRGPARFLGDKSILSQMEEGGPVNAETAFRLHTKSIVSKKDLTPQERRDEYRNIAQQMRDRFQGMRSTQRLIDEEQLK